MKFKDFQAPVRFSGTFTALTLGEKIQVLSRMRGNPGIDEESAKEVAKEFVEINEQRRIYCGQFE